MSSARLKEQNSDTESGEEKESGIDVLFSDEEERERIMRLPEAEREQIIAERYEQQDIIRKLIEKERKRMINPTKSKRPRAPSIESLSSEEESPKRRKKRRKRHDDDEYTIGRPKKVKEPKRQPQVGLTYDHKKESAKLTLEDIEKIRISRDQLAKWASHLYFEKTVIGAFVKVHIGVAQRTQQPIYLMCEVAGVVTQSDYYLIDPKQKAETNKILILTHGKTKKQLKMSIVSNAQFTHEEFDKYMSRLTAEGIKPVTRSHIEAKIAEILTAQNYKYSDAEYEELRQKQLEINLERGTLDSKAATLEIEKLKVQLAEAKDNWENTEDVMYKERFFELDKRIRQIEKFANSDVSVVDNQIIEQLNERNRQKQLEIDAKRSEEMRRQRKKSESKPVVEEKKTVSKIHLELTLWEQDNILKQKILQMHKMDLDVDSFVTLDAPIKVVAPEYPPLEVPLCEMKDEEEVVNIQAPETFITLEDWKKENFASME